MGKGRNNQLTKQVGEYLVSAELSRLGFLSTPFAGNVPDFDILAINDKSEPTYVQVKTIRGGNWQFDGNKYMDIVISGGEIIMQTITGKKPLKNPDLILILVKLVARGKDEFYILQLKDLQEIIFKEYKKWLDKHGGKRPNKPDSTHNSVKPNVLANYKDNWKLLESRT